MITAYRLWFKSGSSQMQDTGISIVQQILWQHAISLPMVQKTVSVINASQLTNSDWSAIAEPFHTHSWVSHGFQSTFQVNIFSFINRFWIWKWLHKNWFGLRNLLNMVLWLDKLGAFKMLRLLHCRAVHAGCINTGTHCNAN